MRRIGSHAHPLTVVNYFSCVLFLVATVLVIVQQMAWPNSLEAWGCMTLVGVFGGLMVRCAPVNITSRHRSTHPSNTDSSRRNFY